jgi:two-component system, OmpR family, phosphate regulon response regulator OmpR
MSEQSVSVRVRKVVDQFAGMVGLLSAVHPQPERHEEEPMPTILIVDDDELLRGMLATFLQEQGYDCTLAENVAKARGHLNKQHFQLTLSDFNMPSESGLDLLRYVKSGSHATSFILMSAETNQDLRNEALELGAAACIAKPFKLQELLSGIENALCQGISSHQVH